MTSPFKKAGRERQLALALLAVGLVLLVSSVTWFGSGQAGVGIAQIVVGLLLAVVGAVLLLRLRRAPGGGQPL